LNHIDVRSTEFELYICYTNFMKKLPKLSKGDKVAVISPSFAAPAVFPAVYELGLRRIREVFELETVRKYNKNIPVVQNMDFGHTAPQIPMPYGNNIRFASKEERIFATF